MEEKDQIQKLYDGIYEIEKEINGVEIKKRKVGKHSRRIISFILQQKKRDNSHLADFIKQTLHIEIERSLVASFLKERLLIEKIENDLVQEFLISKRISYVGSRKKFPMLWTPPSNYFEVFKELSELSNCEELKNVQMKLCFNGGNEKEVIEIIDNLLSEYVAGVLNEMDVKISDYLRDALGKLHY